MDKINFYQVLNKIKSFLQPPKARVGRVGGPPGCAAVDGQTGGVPMPDGQPGLPAGPVPVPVLLLPPQFIMPPENGQKIGKIPNFRIFLRNLSL